MSTKKESERATTEYDVKRELRTELSEQGHAVERVLDETRNNIRRTVDEAKREIPRNTQAINDYQEHTLQASREIVDSYLESQKQIIQSFQSTWVPYIENTYGAFWNNWASPRRVTEIYARTVSNCADNIMATTIPFNIIPLSYASQQVICYIQSETFSSIVLCNSLL